MMPDGSTYSYTYNDNNELEDIRIPGVGNISYPSYTLGRPDRMSSPGDTRSYAYDALARLEDLDSTMLDYSYSYDDVGNILTKSTGHGNYVYDYDNVYRVTDVDNPTLDDEAYTYDGVGNRLTASDVSGSIEHNQNNELQLYGDISFSYDANGNMISKTSVSESWAYTYNVQNRLVQVEEDDLLVAEYGYDPFGRRLWKEVDGTRTYFLYSAEGLVAEYDEDGVEIRSYGYRPDSTWMTDPLWLKEGGAYYWYQNDHLGTPQKLVDSTGTVVWSATYSAFGEAQIEVETVTNNLRFPGQYYDAETGLHDNWHREYDPETGRYTQTDPIEFLGGDVNLYAYVAMNPSNLLDPWGLAAPELTLELITTMSNLIVENNLAISPQVNTALLLCQIWKESQFDPESASGTGAYGYMQVVRSSAYNDAKRLNPEKVAAIGSYDDIKVHPKKNIQIGTLHLDDLLRKYPIVKNAEDPLNKALTMYGPPNDPNYGGNLQKCQQCMEKLLVQCPEITPSDKENCDNPTPSTTIGNVRQCLQLADPGREF